MYNFGNTRTESPPVYDDRDDRAARWTLRLLAASVFVVVLCAALMLTLLSLRDETPDSPSVNNARAETVTTLAPIPEIGPGSGVELPGYITSRKAALASLRDERVAVVSLAKYSTQVQAKALAGSLQVVGLIVAPPGTAPSVVTGDLAAWAAKETEATRTERDEIKKLIPTVTDPAFKTFYNQEVERFDKALRNFAPDSAMVFGVVVKGPAAALQALGAKAEVRLVDVGEFANPDPKAVYRGVRPEETAKANDPPLRP